MSLAAQENMAVRLGMRPMPMPATRPTPSTRQR